MNSIYQDALFAFQSNSNVNTLNKVPGHFPTHILSVHATSKDQLIDHKIVKHNYVDSILIIGYLTWFTNSIFGGNDFSNPYALKPNSTCIWSM